MLLMDVTCLNVVTDVSVGNGVETLTSRIVDWFLVYAHIKAVERVMRNIFIDDLIHKLFKYLGLISGDGTSRWTDSHLIFVHVSSL